MTILLRRIAISLIIAMPTFVVAQSSDSLTLEDIWKSNLFSTEDAATFQFMQDGKHYTSFNESPKGYELLQYNIAKNNDPTNTIISAAQLATLSDAPYEYELSPNEQKISISTAYEPIYRYSGVATYHVFDRKTGNWQNIHNNKKISIAQFSPQSDKIAFVDAQNNLYYQPLLPDHNAVAITTDGKPNHIINGKTDWLYEEEFSTDRFQFTRAFEWSPDGNLIAYLRFNESQVPEFTMEEYHDNVYPEYVTFKYPKVGQPNSTITVQIYDIATKQLRQVLLPNNTNSADIYIPRIRWLNNSKQLCVWLFNRQQTQLQLLLADAQTGKTSVLLTENSKYYIELHDNIHFLANNKQFLWTSEQDGFNHIYLYQLDGKLEKQLTKGNWDVTAVYGVDEKRQKVFYQSAEVSPLERYTYSISLDGKDKQQLSSEKGTHQTTFSPTFDYYIDEVSTADTPPVISLWQTQGNKKIRVLEDNTDTQKRLSHFAMSKTEFFTCNNERGTALNGFMIKPTHFDPARKYPVLMFVYGGPGSQTVNNAWDGRNYGWFQLLAQKGFVVVSVDNSGTGARGEAFKKMTTLQLGKYETEDQIAAARYLGTLPYIDAKRIGIFGWSYGGYLSSLCLFKGNDVFKAGIAVAPVTNWKWYDSAYTERYMRTERENAKGYQQNSPVYFADQLKGSYLLVHGLADDNVHFQHTAEMAKALVDANKQFETYVYTNKNHSIRGGNARLHLYTKMTDFLLKNL